MEIPLITECHTDSRKATSNGKITKKTCRFYGGIKIEIVFGLSLHLSAFTGWFLLNNKQAGPLGLSLIGTRSGEILVQSVGPDSQAARGGLPCPS